MKELERNTYAYLWRYGLFLKFTNQINGLAISQLVPLA